MDDVLYAPYAEGSFDAPIVLVGEAPGAQEEAQNRPFVGASGQLLTTLMHTAGMAREKCRLENVFQFRPPGNDIKPFISLSRKEPQLSPQYLEARDKLAVRLKESKANVIVAVGDIALWTLTGMKQITKRRGSILPSSLLPGRKVIPIIHPAAALRQYIFSYTIVHDLRLAAKQSEFPDIRLKKRNLILSPSFLDCLSYIHTCIGKAKMVSVDIEVANNEVSHIALAMSPVDAISIPLVEGFKDYFTPDQEASILKALAVLLEDEDIVKIGQNLVFDSTFLFRRYGIRVSPVEDTMIGFAIIYPDFPKGLDFITAAYCGGEPYYKDEGKIWRKNPFGSEEDFRRYNAMDAAVAFEAWLCIERDLKRKDNYGTYERQRQLIEPLVYMQDRGIRMDAEALSTASGESAEIITRLTAELQEIAGYEINPNSPPQLKEYFYEILGNKPYVKDGKPTTDDTAMKRLVRKGVPGASHVRDIRSAAKMKGTYYDVRLDADGRLRCSFNPVGTKQGRISSSKTIEGLGGNLQNQPPQMKRLMIADPGMIMVSIDLKQAENRVVAYIANEQQMISAFENGVDVHSQTAALIFRIPVEQVSDEPGSCSVGGGKFSQRFWGKKANHGLNYGQTFSGFALINELPDAEARIMVESYHRVYPGIRRWHSVIRDRINRDRTLTNCFGRKRTFLDRWGDDLFREAYSFIPQSTVADLLNQRGVVYTYENAGIHGQLRYVDLLNQIHDSLIFQYPMSDGTANLAYILGRIRESLEAPIKWGTKTFSIPVEIMVGFNLKDMHDITPGEKSILENLHESEEVMAAYHRG